MDPTSAERSSATGPAAEKKSNKSIFLILGVVGLVILGIAIWGAMTLFQFASGPSDAAKAFVQTLSENNYEGAYAMTSAEFRESTSVEQLGEFVELFPVVDEMTNISFNSFSIDNDLALVSGTISGAGEESPITIELVNVGGDWLVVNLSLEPEDVPVMEEDEDEEAAE